MNEVVIYVLHMIAVGIGLAVLLGLVTLALLLLVECVTEAVKRTCNVWRCVYAYSIHKGDVELAEKYMRRQLRREIAAELAAKEKPE